MDGYFSPRFPTDSLRPFGGVRRQLHRPHTALPGTSLTTDNPIFAPEPAVMETFGLDGKLRHFHSFHFYWLLCSRIPFSSFQTVQIIQTNQTTSTIPERRQGRDRKGRTVWDGEGDMVVGGVWWWLGVGWDISGCPSVLVHHYYLPLQFYLYPRRDLPPPCLQAGVACMTHTFTCPRYYL